MLQRILRKLREEWFYLCQYPVPRYGQDYSVNYDSYWEDRRPGTAAVLSVWQKERADTALRYIKPRSVVADFGCGDGAVLKYFQDQAGVTGIGLDISAPVLAAASALGIKTVPLDTGDKTFFSRLGDVDYITAFEVLEHLPNPETFLFYAYRKARRGIIFSVPNSGYYLHRLRLLFGKLPLQWVTHPGEHLRFWTARDMVFWLKSLPFRPFQLTLYQGIRALNKIFPRLFSKGMIIYIPKNEEPGLPTG